MTSPTSPAAPSDTVRLRQKLAASLDEGVYIDVVESIPSTNTALKESADSSDQDVLLALEQTAGVAPVRTPRGRDILAACGQLKSASERQRGQRTGTGKACGQKIKDWIQRRSNYANKSLALADFQ